MLLHEDFLDFSSLMVINSSLMASVVGTHLASLET